MKKKNILLFLVMLLMLSLFPGTLAAEAVDTGTAFSNAARTVISKVPAPGVGSVGGDWTVMGLARGDCAVPEGYYDNYFAAVEKYVSSQNGVLSKYKNTEYSRVILAITAIGEDPTQVGGYNLLKPLGDFDKTVAQGINGAVFALLALDSKGYAIPQNQDAKTQATRQKYVDYIGAKQLSDDGWGLSGTESDVDTTAMTLQALAKYTDQSNVKTMVDRALNWLSKTQNTSGGFSMWGAENCESVAQVIVALCELCVDVGDSRFTKNRGLMDALLSFYTDGGFSHTGDGKYNQMSTEQALYALAAVDRQKNQKASLYRMSDAWKLTCRFKDISGNKYKTAILTLADKNVMNGVGGGRFEPDRTITRGEFAAILIRCLGMEAKYAGNFSDAPANMWYSAYIDTACANGIVGGVGGGKFEPNRTVTIQEAAAMTARAAQKLDIGGESPVKFEEVMAFCVDNGILDKADSTNPKQGAARGLAAQMICNLMSVAKLG